MTGYSLGERLKLRRKELGLSLRELATRTDVTASFLSQVENGKTNMSLDTLRLVAEVLKVPLVYFFSEGKNSNKPSSLYDGSNGNKYNPVVREGHRPRIILPDSGVIYEKLVPDMNRSMEPFFGRLMPGKQNVARALREPTEEFIYVLSGSLLIGLEEEDYVLNKGDSIYFEGRKLRRLICASENEEAVWISVISPPVF